MGIINIVFIVSLLFGLFLSRLIAGKWKFGYILGGLLFGLYNEIVFEFCWTYSKDLAPMIWRDVPLVVVIGWGVVSGISFALSDRIVEKFKIKNGVKVLILDILIFSVLGVINETSLSAMGYWKYNFPILGTIGIVLLGYVSVALITSSIARRIEGIISK